MFQLHSAYKNWYKIWYQVYYDLLLNVCVCVCVCVFTILPCLQVVKYQQMVLFYRCFLCTWMSVATWRM